MRSHLALSISLSLLTVTALPETGLPETGLAQTGRTTDGRAYRTDAEGNKVVDYIAELEANVESLNRQVQGLEEELQEKVQIIGRLQNGQAPQAGGIKERDLLPDAAAKTVTDYSWTCPKMDCREVVDNAEARVKAEYDERIARVQIKLRAASEEQQALEAREPGSRERSTEALSKELRDATDRIAQLQDELNAKTDAYAILEARMAAAEKRLAVASAKQAGTAQLSEPAPGAQRDQRASLAPRVIAPGDTNLSQSRMRAIESVKGSLATEINRTQALVVTRDKLYKEYGSSKSGAITFSPSSAISSDRQSLDDLRSKLTTVATMRDVMLIKNGIREIQRKMEDDIGLVTRLRRVQ